MAPVCRGRVQGSRDRCLALPIRRGGEAVVARDDGACTLRGTRREREQGFYAFCARREAPPSASAAEDATLADAGAVAHEVGRQNYGMPRIKSELATKRSHTSRRRISRLRTSLGLRVRAPRAFVRTTNADPTLTVSPNLLNREFVAAAPNTGWVSDPSYRSPLLPDRLSTLTRVLRGARGSPRPACPRAQTTAPPPPALRPSAPSSGSDPARRWPCSRVDGRASGARSGTK